MHSGGDLPRNLAADLLAVAPIDRKGQMRSTNAKNRENQFIELQFPLSADPDCSGSASSTTFAAVACDTICLPSLTKDARMFESYQKPESMQTNCRRLSFSAAPFQHGIIQADIRIRNFECVPSTCRRGLEPQGLVHAHGAGWRFRRT
jgi:hypothetical protein